MYKVYPFNCVWYIIFIFLQCSATCRGGVRTREVTCVRPIFNETLETMDPILDVNSSEILEVVNDTVCIDEGIFRPANTLACNAHINCPFRYKVGNWSAVSTTLVCNYYTVYPEILAVFKIGGLVQGRRNKKNIGRLKFGCLVRYHHTYVHIYTQ